MSSLISISIIQSAMEQGLIYALVALALYISFSTLNLCDLSTDGCFTLGCAVCAQVALTGHPFLALLAAMGVGICSGFVTASLQTRLGVQSIVAGIVVNTGLYTVNLAVMGFGSKTGFASTINMFGATTIFDLTKTLLFPIVGSWYKLITSALIVAFVGLILVLFFGTRLGLSIRATGDNSDMVRTSSIDPAFTITIGLCLSNSLTGLAGGLLGQYQKSCDINLGTGMVTIALASLIIGETLIGKGGVARHVFGVILGSCLYRFIIALALRLNVDASCLKLVSAVIVAVAIASPTIKQTIAFKRRKAQAVARHKERIANEAKEDEENA